VEAGGSALTCENGSVITTPSTAPSWGTEAGVLSGESPVTAGGESPFAMERAEQGTGTPCAAGTVQEEGRT
jgi:hypothetical protein